jgi:hypothetical protein
MLVTDRGPTCLGRTGGDEALGGRNGGVAKTRGELCSLGGAVSRWKSGWVVDRFEEHGALAADGYRG